MQIRQIIFKLGPFLYNFQKLLTSHASAELSTLKQVRFFTHPVLYKILKIYTDIIVTARKNTSE